MSKEKHKEITYSSDSDEVMRSSVVSVKKSQPLPPEKGSSSYRENQPKKVSSSSNLQSLGSRKDLVDDYHHTRSSSASSKPKQRDVDLSDLRQKGGDKRDQFRSDSRKEHHPRDRQTYAPLERASSSPERNLAGNNRKDISPVLPQRYKVSSKRPTQVQSLRQQTTTSSSRHSSRDSSHHKSNRPPREEREDERRRQQNDSRSRKDEKVYISRMKQGEKERKTSSSGDVVRSRDENQGAGRVRHHHDVTKKVKTEPEPSSEGSSSSSEASSSGSSSEEEVQGNLKRRDRSSSVPEDVTLESGDIEMEGHARDEGLVKSSSEGRGSVSDEGELPKRKERIPAKKRLESQYTQEVVWVPSHKFRKGEYERESDASEEGEAESEEVDEVPHSKPIKRDHRDQPVKPPTSSRDKDYRRHRGSKPTDKTSDGSGASKSSDKQRRAQDDHRKRKTNKAVNEALEAIRRKERSPFWSESPPRDKKSKKIKSRSSPVDTDIAPVAGAEIDHEEAYDPQTFLGEAKKSPEGGGKDYTEEEKRLLAFIPKRSRFEESSEEEEEEVLLQKLLAAGGGVGKMSDRSSDSGRVARWRIEEKEYHEEVRRAGEWKRGSEKDSPSTEVESGDEDVNRRSADMEVNSSDSDGSPITSKKPYYYPATQGCRSVEEFKCLNRIEEGTYGVVYRALDKKINEIVALKRLKMEKEKNGFPITSLREINTLMKAQHENIVTVREVVVGSNMDKIYLVMDYVEHDLKALMETMKEPFLIGEVKCLLQQLLRAVRHLHDNWILHRDLKTSNLLLSHRGILKVGDFGLAREYGSPLKNYTEVVVTLWYRAPELLLGSKTYSCPIDVWSVGCIFGEFLLKKALFPGRGETDELNLIFRDLGTPSEDIWPGVSELPAMKKCTFTDYRYNHLRKRFGNHLSDEGFNLMNKFLTYCPDRRITADDALKHAYFSEKPLPIHPSQFPTWPAKSEGGAHPGHKRAASPRPPSGGKGAALGVGADESPTGTGTGFHMSGGGSMMGQGFHLHF